MKRGPVRSACPPRVAGCVPPTRGALIGVGPKTLRSWAWREERNTGARPGLSDEAYAEVRQLPKENEELKRANEILSTVNAGSRCS